MITERSRSRWAKGSLNALTPAPGSRSGACRIRGFGHEPELRHHLNLVEVEMRFGERITLDPQQLRSAAGEPAMRRRDLACGRRKRALVRSLEGESLRDPVAIDDLGVDCDPVGGGGALQPSSFRTSPAGGVLPFLSRSRKRTLSSRRQGVLRPAGACNPVGLHRRVLAGWFVTSVATGRTRWVTSSMYGSPGSATSSGWMRKASCARPSATRGAGRA